MEVRTVAGDLGLGMVGDVAQQHDRAQTLGQGFHGVEPVVTADICGLHGNRFPRRLSGPAASASGMTVQVTTTDE